MLECSFRNQTLIVLQFEDQPLFLRQSIERLINALAQLRCPERLFGVAVTARGSDGLFKSTSKTVARFTIDRDLLPRLLSLPEAVETNIGGNSEDPSIEARLLAKLADGAEYFQECLLIRVSSFVRVSKQTYGQAKNVTIVFEDQLLESLTVSRLSSFDEQPLVIHRLHAGSMFRHCSS